MHHLKRTSFTWTPENRFWTSQVGFMDFSDLKIILGEKVDLRTSIFQVQRTPKINQVFDKIKRHGV